MLLLSLCNNLQRLSSNDVAKYYENGLRLISDLLYLETPALRRAGTNDENDFQERITRMVTNGSLLA
jgi:hypothetical protein